MAYALNLELINSSCMLFLLKILKEYLTVKPNKLVIICYKFAELADELELVGSKYWLKQLVN